MKNSEEAIERVLSGLRDVEAPAGMERRILERLEGRALPGQARSDWRWFMSSWATMPPKRVAVKALIYAAALAGVVAAVFVAPAIRRFGSMPEQPKAGVLPRAAVRTAPVIAAGVAELASGRSRASSGMTAKTPVAKLVRVADSDASPTDDDVAKNDMETASFPAPPMPLTAQERMLLRLANKVDPVEMAMLDPKFRVIDDAEEKEEFQRFFGQVPVKLVDPTQAAAGESTADQAVQPSTTDQGVTVQALPDEAVQPKGQAAPAIQDRVIQKQATPEQSSPDRTSPDQSSKQQPTVVPITTAEKE